jgi:hypothetical protein
MRRLAPNLIKTRTKYSPFYPLGGMILILAETARYLDTLNKLSESTIMGKSKVSLCHICVALSDVTNKVTSPIIGTLVSAIGFFIPKKVVSPQHCSNTAPAPKAGDLATGLQIVVKAVANFITLSKSNYLPTN